MFDLENKKEEIIKNLANLFNDLDIENLDAADFVDRASDIVELVESAKEINELQNKGDKKMIENFIVKHYHGQSPTIKGNSFDGLEIGEDREEAEEFISFVNSIINKNNQLEERIVSLLESEEKLSCLETFGVDNWCEYDLAMETMEATRERENT
jgi:hypothetical protein